MSPISARGRPREFDSFLRPPARMVQLLLGGLGTAILLWLGNWWWAPAPLVLSFVLYEAVFSGRSDKPIELRLEQDEARLRDRFLARDWTVPLSGVHSASLVYRGADTGMDAVLVLCDERAVLLALQFHTTRERLAPRPHDVDADLAHAVLGSISGLIRALAPREALVRQVFDDPAPLDWFRERLPAEVWERSTLRYWRGEAPDLDLFGYHATAADGLIQLEGDTVRVDGAAGPVSPETPLRSERIAVLFRMYGEEHEESSERLPLWIQPLGEHRVAIPAPLIDPDIDEQAKDASWLHVHPPEGAVLLWHLWRTTPRERWPAAWTEALRHARPNVEVWPDAIPVPD